MQPQGEVDLEALSQKIDSLASQRLEMINEYKHLDQRRREIRKQIREFTDNINADRKSLDEYYEHLTSYKATRREVLSKIREMKVKSSEVEKVLKEFEKSAPKGGEALHERLKKVEWRLQTERLSRDEEKQLVAVVKDLETKLKAWKKADTTKKEYTSVQDQIKLLKSKLDEMNKFRAEKDPEVRARHERVATMLNQRHQLFQEIEDINNSLMELDAKITKNTGELDGLRIQRRSLVEGRKVRDYESSKAKTRQLVDRARGDAKKKLEQGEKLSLDELRLAFGDDSEVLK
ncbi:MAG TPA: hypothetical protein VFF30_01870 [Nitrososphaerales archaeon]|nr:hypothetical protein [Nitrososphaerales archaeon]